jgi:hypothetical protein
VEPPTDGHPTGVIVIPGELETAFYDVTEILCEFPNCRGFALTKHTPDREQYHVLLADNPQDHSCDCPGFLRWSHCKHVSGLRALIGGEL